MSLINLSKLNWQPWSCRERKKVVRPNLWCIFWWKPVWIIGLWNNKQNLLEYLCFTVHLTSIKLQISCKITNIKSGPQNSKYYCFLVQWIITFRLSQAQYDIILLWNFPQFVKLPRDLSRHPDYDGGCTMVFLSGCHWVLHNHLFPCPNKM